MTIIILSEQLTIQQQQPPQPPQGVWVRRATLTGEELSEDVFEILIDLFASPGSEHRQDSRGSGHRQDSRVPEAHVYTQD